MNATRVTPPTDRAQDLAALHQDGFTALDACHRGMLEAGRALEQLLDLAARSGFTAEARAAAARIAAFFGQTAAQHHEHEERHVFPALLASRDPELARAVKHLRDDHERLDELWMALEPHVLAIASGYEIRLDTLASAARAFTTLHRRHIRLEESLAYPAARRELGEDGCREMGRKMFARELE